MLARVGQDVKITYWWRCDDTIEDGWALFTHLHDDVSDKSDVVTVVLGKNFKQLATPSDVRAAMALLSQPTAPAGTCGITAG